MFCFSNVLMVSLILLANSHFILASEHWLVILFFSQKLCSLSKSICLVLERHGFNSRMAMYWMLTQMHDLGHVHWRRWAGFCTSELRKTNTFQGSNGAFEGACRKSPVLQGFYQRTLGSGEGGQVLDRHSSCPLWSAAGTGSPEFSSKNGHRHILVLTPRFSSLPLYLTAGQINWVFQFL